MEEQYVIQDGEVNIDDGEDAEVNIDNGEDAEVNIDDDEDAEEIYSYSNDNKTPNLIEGIESDSEDEEYEE